MQQLQKSKEALEERTKSLEKALSELEKEKQRAIENEADLENTLNSIGEAVITADIGGFITRMNPVAETLTGWKRSEAIGKHLQDVLKLVNTQNKKEISNPINDVLKFGRIINLSDRTTLISKSGKKYQISNITTPIKIEEQKSNGIVLTFKDETEKLKKEQQLIQTQKMEAISILTGGMSHDLNNILSCILAPTSMIEIIANKLNSVYTDEINEYIEMIRKSTDRASNLVRQLLSVSQRHEVILKTIDLNDAIKNVLHIAKNSFDKSIDIHATFYPSPALTDIDPAQIEQVLLNILINASHAMTHMREKGEVWGGQLEIVLTKIYIDEYLIKLFFDAEIGYYWLLSIKDTGKGIPQDIISEIFTPFFTTQKKGTGLGLSMAYNIIKQNEGFIKVYSKVGVGTNFDIYLKESEKELESDTQGPISEKLQKLKKGEGVILFVDDEEFLLISSKNMLEEWGYSVIIAKNGEEALQIFQEKQSQIHIVILDLIMPQMSGYETFIKMKEINPNTKIIITSGFGQDQRVQKLLELGADGFIQKPYDFHKLISVIYKIPKETNKDSE